MELNARQELIGSEDVQVETENLQSGNIYWGFQLKNSHVKRHMKPLRAGQSTMEMKPNIFNTAGLGYKYKAMPIYYLKKAEHLNSR